MDHDSVLQSHEQVPLRTLRLETPSPNAVRRHGSSFGIVKYLGRVFGPVKLMERIYSQSLRGRVVGARLIQQVRRESAPLGNLGGTVGDLLLLVLRH